MGLFLYLQPMAKEVRVRGVNNQIVDDLEAIAKNLGITVTALLKPKLREIRDSYPEKMRIPPPKD